MGFYMFLPLNMGSTVDFPHQSAEEVQRNPLNMPFALIAFFLLGNYLHTIGHVIYDVSNMCDHDHDMRIGSNHGS